MVERSLRACGFEVHAEIIWVKTRFALSRGHYHWRHEPCYYAVRRGAGAHWRGGRKQQTVWADIVDTWEAHEGLFAARVDADTVLAFGAEETTVWEIGGSDGQEETTHATQKPLECMARPIRLHEGDVYDPFLGSGTTMVAAEELGRLCHGMETEPPYVAVALQRLADMGLEPQRMDG